MQSITCPIRSGLALSVLSAAVLLVACDRDREPTAPADPTGGLQADLGSQNLSYLEALFFANEPLIPDGSLTQDDPLPSGHTIHVVDRNNKDSWKIDGSTEVITYEDDLTCDPLEVPLPAGALRLMSATNDQVTRLRATRYHRTYLRDLTRLDYWACDTRNSSQWPYVVLDIDWNGDNQIDDRIIFEPSHQNLLSPNPLCGTGSNQPAPLLNKWQFWDGLRGTPGDPTTFRACWYSAYEPEDEPLSTYIEEHPNAAIVNLDGNHGGVQITHGEGVGGFDGWVDAFTIGKDINHTSGQTQNSTITYDFQKP